MNKGKEIKKNTRRRFFSPVFLLLKDPITEPHSKIVHTMS